MRNAPMRRAGYPLMCQVMWSCLCEAQELGELLDITLVELLCA